MCCICICYACSNAGGTCMLSEECFGSCFPQVHLPLNWLNSAQRNLRPEIKSLSKPERLFRLPIADRSWWEQSQEEELIWEAGSVPNPLQAASGEDSGDDTACGFAQTRRCLCKARHFPYCDGAASHSGRTVHGTLLFTYGPYGMQRHAKRVLGLCTTENLCSPQLQACKNIELVRFSDPYFSSSKTLQRCSISSFPSPWANHCCDTLNFIFWQKSLLWMYGSMEWGGESSPVLNEAGQDLGSHWFNISYKVLERHWLSGYGTECVAYCVFSHSAAYSFAAVQQRESPFPPLLQSVSWPSETIAGGLPWSRYRLELAAFFQTEYFWSCGRSHSAAQKKTSVTTAPGKVEARRITSGKCMNSGFLSLSLAHEPLRRAETIWIHSRKLFLPFKHSYCLRTDRKWTR